DRAVEGNQPGGVANSSYATGGEGLAAYATLLNHYHYSTSQQRGSLASQTPLDPNTTMFVIEPSVMTHDDEATLLDFVSSGGRLVIGGREPFYLDGLRDDPPKWTTDGRVSWFTPNASVGGVRSIAA